MEKRNVIIVILVMIIILLLVFVILLMTNGLKFNTNTENNNTTNGQIVEDNTLNNVSKPENLTKPEMIEWNKYLNEKVFALVLAKRNNINSEMTAKDKAEFVCFWAESNDRENYNKNLSRDEKNSNIFYVEGTYLIDIVNKNFSIGVTGQDYAGKNFTNGYYYIHEQEQNLEFTFIPKVKNVIRNSSDGTFTVDFVTLKSTAKDQYSSDITTYDESQVENTYKLVVTKNENDIKIVSIKKI